MKEQGEHILVHCSSVFEYYPLHQKRQLPCQIYKECN